MYMYMCTCVNTCTRIHLQEFYGDYIAVAQHLFSFNIEACCEPGGTVWRRELFYRTSDGLKSVLLALRKRPIIRSAEEGERVRGQRGRESDRGGEIGWEKRGKDWWIREGGGEIGKGSEVGG